MYLKYSNNTVKYPYSFDQLRKDNPTVTFFYPPDERILSKYDVFEVKKTTPPTFDSITHRVFEQTPELVNGVWIQSWKLEQRHDAAIRIRNYRNLLISQTDYLALSDNTLTPDMAEYRQQLRDITNQPTFPSSVVWPTKPE